MSDTTPTHIESLDNFLKDHSFRSKIWKNRRIYLSGFKGGKYDRDIKVYIELDEPLEEVPEVSESSPVHPLLTGCAVKVFSDADQGRQWLINRSKQCKRGVAAQLHEVGLLKDAPPEDWREMA